MERTVSLDLLSATINVNMDSSNDYYATRDELYADLRRTNFDLFVKMYSELTWNPSLLRSIRKSHVQEDLYKRYPFLAESKVQQ